MLVSWPSYYGDFGLQFVTSLSIPNSWSAVAGQPTVVGNLFTFTNNIPGTNTFFRLKGD